MSSKLFHFNKIEFLKMNLGFIPQAYTLDMDGTWELSLIHKRTLSQADYAEEDLLKKNGESNYQQLTQSISNITRLSKCLKYLNKQVTQSLKTSTAEIGRESSTYIYIGSL